MNNDDNNKKNEELVDIEVSTEEAQQVKGGALDLGKASPIPGATFELPRLRIPDIGNVGNTVMCPW